MRDASSQLVIASGRPERVSGPFSGTADVVGDSIRVDSPLSGGDSYTVQTRIPEATPADLTAAPSYDPSEVPAGSTRLRATFWGDPVDVPLWGSGAPAVDPGLARPVRGGPRSGGAGGRRRRDPVRRGQPDRGLPAHATTPTTSSPRTRPAFPTTGRPTCRRGGPPLVDFLFGSRRGYCQHFAGSMAVMLRSLGIPARVAVGYTGGRFDAKSERWVVTDRDAHAWVEVWFPGYGWLPFDPTPGRSAPNPASVSSPDYAPSRSEADLGGIADTPVAPVTPPTSTPSTPAPDAGARTPRPPRPAGRARAAARRGGWASRGWPGRARWWRPPGGRSGASAAAAAATSAAAWSRPPASSRRRSPRSAWRRRPRRRRPSARRTSASAPASTRRRSTPARPAARYASEPPAPGEAAAAWRESSRLRRAIRRRAPRGRRVLSALGLRRAPRDTVDR